METPPQPQEQALLHDPIAVRERLIGHYYRFLNADDAFRSDLGALFAALERAGQDQADTLLADFFQRWPLPPDGQDDLRAAFHQRHQWGEPVLARLPRYTPFSRPVPFVHVAVRDTFEFDPLQEDRRYLEAQIDRLCRQVRQQALGQALQHERQARAEGWERLPPAYHEPEKLREAAQRLYWRAVKGWSWGQIAMKSRTRRQSIQEQVTQLATLLGIPLK